jgi:hypothetical protein
MMMVCWVVAPCRFIDRRKRFSPEDGVIRYYETLASTDESSCRQDPEEEHRHRYRPQGLNLAI